MKNPRFSIQTVMDSAATVLCEWTSSAEYDSVTFYRQVSYNMVFLQSDRIHLTMTYRCGHDRSNLPRLDMHISAEVSPCCRLNDLIINYRRLFVCQEAPFSLPLCHDEQHLTVISSHMLASVWDEATWQRPRCDPVGSPSFLPSKH